MTYVVAVRHPEAVVFVYDTLIVRDMICGGRVVKKDYVFESKVVPLAGIKGAIGFSGSFPADAQHISRVFLERFDSALSRYAEGACKEITEALDGVMGPLYASQRAFYSSLGRRASSLPQEGFLVAVPGAPPGLYTNGLDEGRRFLPRDAGIVGTTYQDTVGFLAQRLVKGMPRGELEAVLEESLSITKRCAAALSPGEPIFGGKGVAIVGNGGLEILHEEKGWCEEDLALYPSLRGP